MCYTALTPKPTRADFAFSNSLKTCMVIHSYSSSWGLNSRGKQISNVTRTMILKQHHPNWMVLFRLPRLADHAAGDFSSCVTGRLGVEVIVITMDDHSAANDFFYRKTVCSKRQICVPLAPYQRRQIACMFRMGLPCWVIMALCA